MLKINYMRNNQLNFRSISHLEEREAAEILNQLNVTPTTNQKNKPKEQNYIIRNGTMMKLEQPDFNYNLDNKIVTQSKTSHLAQEKSYRAIESHARDDKVKDAQSLERKGSWVHQFRNQSSQDYDRLKEELCRVWYEKIALEGHCAAVLEDSARKDEIINQLRLQLDIKNTPNQGNIILNMPNNNQMAHHHSNQNKTISNVNLHQHFTHQPPQMNPQPNQWGSLHQPRNFQPNNFRNNF